MEETVSKLKKVQDYLAKKGYQIEDHICGEYTFRCTNYGMDFFVKLTLAATEDDKRILELKNEVAAINNLWKAFPEGETKTFSIPPGTEDEFTGKIDDEFVYGYARFWVDAKVLSTDIRNGQEKVENWVGKFAEIAKEIDTLPDLQLPRTQQKQKEDFIKTIDETSKYWMSELEKRVEMGDVRMSETEENLDDFMENVRMRSNQIREYFKENRVITGTSLQEFTPDHVLYGIVEKPYISTFSKLSQSYPRFYDIASMYSWLVSVTGDIPFSMVFFENASDRLAVDQKAYLKIITNHALIGSVYNYLKLEKPIIKANAIAFFD